MSSFRACARQLFGALVLAVALTALGHPADASAAGGEATWQLEQPAPPPPPLGVEGSSTPIGLGHVGDIEFLGPNRGLLITAGDGSAIPAGIWAYDGAGWKQLAIVCGATNGRIAWGGQDEFWTISDGRPGEVPNAGNGELPPLEDDTLCHFAPNPTVTPPAVELEVVRSYASLAFQASSYQAMDAAGCIGADDCWFAGEPLPAGLPATGSFHLHWNGTTLTEEPYEGEAQPIRDMRVFEGRLYESVAVSPPPVRELVEPPVLHVINPAGVTPLFEEIPGEGSGESGPSESGAPRIPLRGHEVFVEALRGLHLSADEHALWAATSAVPEQDKPELSKAGQVTVARLDPKEHEGEWQQLLGSGTNPSGEALFPGQVVESIAAEPGTDSAWLALDSERDDQHPSPGIFATIARIAANGVVSDEQTLPSQAEQEKGVGPKGAAARITCPAAQDCWLVTTQGWLFHLTTGTESLPVDDEGFSSLITSRPRDEGLPQAQPDAPPEEEFGLPGEAPPSFTVTKAEANTEGKIKVALVSNMHSRLVHGSTLELRFHLAAKARVRLLAKRHKSTVASTPQMTFAAGSRKLLLKLNPSKWPTGLDLQTHALAPLPTISDRSPSVE
jgi:hypothetical protein